MLQLNLIGLITSIYLIFWNFQTICLRCQSCFSERNHLKFSDHYRPQTIKIPVENLFLKNPLRIDKKFPKLRDSTFSFLIQSLGLFPFHSRFICIPKNKPFNQYTVRPELLLYQPPDGHRNLNDDMSSPSIKLNINALVSEASFSLIHHHLSCRIRV